MAEIICKGCGHLRDEEKDFYSVKGKKKFYRCRYCHSKYMRNRYRKRVGIPIKKYNPHSRGPARIIGWIPNVGDKFIPIVREFGNVALEHTSLHQEFWVCDSCENHVIHAGLFQFPCAKFLFRKWIKMSENNLTDS